MKTTKNLLERITYLCACGYQKCSGPSSYVSTMVQAVNMMTLSMSYY
ncbi:hypothetical protein ABES25_23625 [Bacillus gobiensis]